MAALPLVHRNGTLREARGDGRRPAAAGEVESGQFRARGKEESVAQAYCVRDKQKVEIKDPQNITMKNGKPAIKGTCPICGNSVFRIGAG